MSETTSRLRVSAPPHIAAPTDVTRIMGLVLLALAPAVVWAVVNMGTAAVVLLACCIGSCVATEWAWNAVTKRPQTLRDLSAVVTGVLLAMSLPPRTPWWIAVVGGLVSIGLAKMLFGGLGWNLFNPALVGRAIVVLSWAGVFSEIKPNAGGWYGVMPDQAGAGVDTISGATRLALAAADRASAGAYKFDMAAQYGPLLWKNLEGSLGEVSGGLLLLGGLFLIVMRIVDWRIPAGYIGSVALLSWAFGSDPIFNVLAGGVLLGALFMATDYVSSPVTRWGKLVFGVGCGTFNVVTRFFGPMPETTTFAILFMNGLAPLIDRGFRPRTFGWVKSRG